MKSLLLALAIVLASVVPAALQEITARYDVLCGGTVVRIDLRDDSQTREGNRTGLRLFTYVIEFDSQHDTRQRLVRTPVFKWDTKTGEATLENIDHKTGKLLGSIRCDKPKRQEPRPLPSWLR